MLPPDKPAQLPEGIALYQTFDPGNESACRLFDLSTDTYDEQYQQITDWARNQPNIIDAVIAYIESHSENGVLAGHHRRKDPIVNMPEGWMWRKTRSDWIDGGEGEFLAAGAAGSFLQY